MLKEFKDFAMRGNVVDMAVGIIIGAAFGAIIKSLVADVLMPLVGMLLGNVDFANLFIILKQGDPAGPYANLAAAQEAANELARVQVMLDAQDPGRRQMMSKNQEVLYFVAAAMKHVGAELALPRGVRKKANNPIRGR